MATYACSDLHGRIDLYNKIKMLLNPGDIVYFLGDANDRGYYGWDLMNAILDDNQFVYIKGNHEDMFINAALDALKTRGTTDNITMLFQNGGAKTLSGFARAGRPREIIDKLIDLPTHAEYINDEGQMVLLSHAGYTPKLDENGDLIIPDEEYLLWDREHSFDEWDEITFDNYVVVHGHTPSCYLAADLNYPGDELEVGPFWYDNHHKVCIDNACYYSGFACLLDLDTWDYTILKTL